MSTQQNVKLPPHQELGKNGDVYQKYHPSGSYQATVVDHVLTESTTKHTPMLRFRIKINKLNKMANGGSVPSLIMGSLRNMDLYLTDKTAEKAKSFTHKAGFRGTNIAELDEKLAKESGVKFVSLAGYTFEVENKSEKTSDGKTFDKFQLPYDGGDSWKEDLRTPDVRRAATLNLLWNSQRQVSAASVVNAPNPTRSNEPPPFDAPLVDDGGSEQFSDDSSWD